MVQQAQQEQTEKRNPPIGPKAERELSPELKAKLAELETLLPQDIAEFGTAKDQALAHVQAAFKAVAEKHKPELRAQMDLLQAKVAADGGFDPAKYQKHMLQFQERLQKEGVGIYPAPVEAARTAIKKAEADCAADSIARKTLLALDKKAFPETFPALMRENYSKVLETIHAVENPPKKEKEK